MDIDIIIPTYKPSYFLFETLKSIESQSIAFEKFKVTIILNGDKEPYYSNIKSLLEGFDFNCSIIYTEEKGVSNARNLGIEKTNYPYIVFLDDDDIISENYLLELFNVAKSNTLAVSNFYSFTKNIYNCNSYFLTFSEHFFVKVGLKRRQIYSTVTGKLIHRNMIQEKRFNSGFKLGEDALFMFLITSNISFVESTSPNCVYFRRIRSNSAISSKKTKLYYFNSAISQILEYTKIYFKAPFEYSFLLYTNRLLAVVKMFFINFSRK